MAERWFDPEELAELSRPTMDRAIEAIEGGDLDRAVELCTDMKREWLMLHDLMVGGMAGLITFVQDRMGDEGVREAWMDSNERGWKRHVESINRLERKELVRLLAATWRAHPASPIGSACRRRRTAVRSARTAGAGMRISRRSSSVSRPTRMRYPPAQ